MEQEAGIKPIIDTKIRREEPFPEDSEGKFNAIFSAIGNSEAKCVTLLSLHNYPQTWQELHAQFLEASGRVWTSARNLQRQYAEDSLIPIGLVAEADTLFYGSSEYVTGYRLTTAGLQFGQPIAAFLLQKSADFPNSFREIFGQTSSSGQTRSVINRAGLLEFLHNNSSETSNLRLTDILHQLNIKNKAMSQNLSELSRLGFVDYSATAPEVRGQIEYTVTDDARRKLIEPIRRSPSTTNLIAQIMFELKTADYPTIQKEVEKRLGRKISPNSIRAFIPGLLKQGVLTSEFNGSNTKSKTRITASGKKLVEEIILPVKQALSPQGSGLLESWQHIRWRDYAPDAVRKYKESSGNVNQKPLEEWANDTYDLIAANPGIRPKDIKSRLGRDSGNPLNLLLKQGRIRKEKEGTVTHYYLF